VDQEKLQWQSPQAVAQGAGVMVTLYWQLAGGFTMSQSHSPEMVAPENVPLHFQLKAVFDPRAGFGPGSGLRLNHAATTRSGRAIANSFIFSPPWKLSETRLPRAASCH
jgi:hypothetical protein